MVRRALLSAVLIAGTVASGWAADSATFLLINGQRHSGYIIYGRGNNNMVDLQYHVNVAGNDVAIPREQIAAIDFVGGNPSQSELDALPSDGQTGVMVMRNGSTVRGHLFNIIGSGNVQWVNQSGQRLDYPIGDVSRLYLIPPVARLAYNATAAQERSTGTSGQGQRTGAANQGQRTGTAGQRQRTRTAGQGQRTGTAGQGQRRGTSGDQGGDRIRVDANQEWIDTGIDVRRGDRLVFNVRGTITVADGGPAIGPDGTTGSRNARYPLRNAPLGALIGGVDDGAPFFIGANAQQITMPASGRLWLGINDDFFDDNRGAFTVTIVWQ
jgi:hypothetical protein